VFDAQGTQHVVYRTSDDRVAELRWDNNGWHYNDLTAASGGAPQPASFVRSGYMFNAQGTQHVVYMTGNPAGHIIELWWDGNGWHHNDLTVAAGGAPLTLDVPHGYVFDSQGTQHVVYLAESGQGLDGHIIELWWDSNGWHHNDLTVSSGGAPLAVGRPTGYAFDHQQTQHVVYRAASGHIIELWWDNSGWHHNDLTVAAGDAALPDSNPTGYVFDAQHTQHVVYLANAHIHELWWSSNGWHHNDLTVAAGGAPLAASDPVGYPFNAQRTQHVVYVASNPAGHIIELWWNNNGWHHNDLTMAAGGASLAADRPAAYVFDRQYTQHVIHFAADGQGVDGHTIELWWDSQ
jgi:catechol 2,3-dioxygenase-like lactoylglutathione lyase family enzyme